MPERRGPGRVILLNGASSSGKSTLAAALQDALDEPFLHISSDHFVAAGMLPRRVDYNGPFGSGGAPAESPRQAFDWRAMRPRFFAGFHASLPAFAWAGNDLIAEHIIELPSWRRDLAYQLAGLDVYLIGVHCAVHEIDRRERERGDRRSGEGRAHVTADAIHSFGPYDLDVDTTAGIGPDLVAAILRSWRKRAPASAL